MRRGRSRGRAADRSPFRSPGRTAVLTLGCVLGSAAGAPTPAVAQFSDPCAVECGLVLGATSFVVAQGLATAVGRARGGYSTTTQGIVAWGTGFALAAGGGMALSGNGDRQERAVYSAGIGTLVGGLAGLAVGAIDSGSTPESRLAATLVGAALGALAGGVIGAATWEEGVPDGPASAPLAVVSIPIGF